MGHAEPENASHIESRMVEAVTAPSLPILTQARMGSIRGIETPAWAHGTHEVRLRPVHAWSTLETQEREKGARAGREGPTDGPAQAEKSEQAAKKKPATGW